MNPREIYLLACLAEEGGEVAKECHKAQRFGLDDQVTLNPNGPRGTAGPTNRAKIGQEMIDMLGAYQKAVNDGIVEDLGLLDLPFWVRERMARKSEKIEAFYRYAVKIGHIQEETK